MDDYFRKLSRIITEAPKEQIVIVSDHYVEAYEVQQRLQEHKDACQHCTGACANVACPLLEKAK